MLANIQPFNDCFYYSCFYSALFPVLRHFNVSIIPLMVNGIPHYLLESEESESIGMYTRFTFVKSIDEVLAEHGISIEAKQVSADVVEDICQGIAADKPVIISFDCFYSSIREDLYQKQHWSHSLLYFGYDREEKVFPIIEQDDRENIAFAPKQISFEDTRNAYQGYLDHLGREGEYTFFAFHADGDVVSKPDDHPDYRKVYRQNISMLKDPIYEGIEKVAVFTREVDEVVRDVHLLQKNALGILSGLNNVIKIKHAERFLIRTIYGIGSTEHELLTAIINNWTQMRLLIGKYYYSGVYRESSLIKIPGFLEQIVPLESRYYAKLLS